MLAAIYTVLTLLLQPISFGPVQCRISEALTVLPFLFPSATAGLTLGCLLANVLGGSTVLDIVAGPLATLAAGLLTARMPNRWLAPLPPVLVNAAVIGAVLAYATVPAENFLPTFLLFAAEVGVGELGACYVLGLPLLASVQRIRLRRGSVPFFRETKR